MGPAILRIALAAICFVLPPPSFACSYGGPSSLDEHPSVWFMVFERMAIGKIKAIDRRVVTIDVLHPLKAVSPGVLVVHNSSFYVHCGVGWRPRVGASVLVTLDEGRQPAFFEIDAKGPQADALRSWSARLQSKRLVSLTPPASQANDCAQFVEGSTPWASCQSAALFSRADSLLAMTYRSVLSRLSDPSRSKQRASLVESQLDWETFRDRHCEIDARLAGGAGSVNLMDCKTQLTKERVRVLEKMRTHAP